LNHFATPEYWLHYRRLTPELRELADAKFKTEQDYKTSPHLRIRKQIGIKKPGIFAIPGYVCRADSDAAPSLDTARFTICVHCPKVRTTLEREQKTFLFSARTATASFICYTLDEVKSMFLKETV
jgi:hypothetical protein